MRENWDEFLSECVEDRRRMYRRSPQEVNQKALNLQMEELLETNLTPEQKHVVDEVMFARCVAIEEDGERLYQQGMRDGVWLLRKLGVLGLDV